MKKGVIQIFLSNLIFLLFGVLNNFVLPKCLSLDSYAMLKTYMLYIGYASFLGFGYVEGMFLKYGGKKLSEVKNLNFGSNIKTFLGIELIVCFAVLIVGVCISSELIILMSIGVFATNIVNYFKNFCTATAEYKTYSIINSFEKIAIFLFNILFLLFFKIDNYVVYVAVIIVIAILESLYVYFYLKKSENAIFHGRIDICEGRYCINLGIILLLGNSISTLFTGIDQWFVKLLMTNSNFAVYSFAVSLERIIALFITPIATVLYNYLCKDRLDKEINFLKEIIVIWGFILLAAVFPLRIVIDSFIPTYSSGFSIIVLLFCGQSLNCIINSIYVNLYKANRKQNYFLKQTIVMTVIATLLNGFFYAIWGNMICIAAATLTTKFMWLIWCQMALKEYKYSFKANMAIMLYIIAYIIAANLKNWTVGMFIYLLLFALITFVLLRDTLIRGITEAKSYVIGGKK